MPYNVLIADNQRGVSRLLRSALETIEQGLLVSEVQSGEEAILDARHKKTDLLVTDYRLPGITGLELMRKFRVVNPDCKVILIADNVDANLLRQVAEAQPDSFFQKPVPLGDFLEAVEKNLGLARTVLSSVQPEAPAGAEPSPEGLSSLLVNLRKNVGAQAVLLLNNDGEIKAEAGQVPAELRRNGLIGALIGLRVASQKAANLLNRAESFVHIFKGESLDAILVHTGPGHALLLVGAGLAETRAVSSRLRLITSARTDLMEALNNILVEPEAPPAPAPVPAAVEPAAKQEELPGDFLKIFSQTGGPAADANSFWDSAVEQGTTFSEPDKLTYEQAARLGLTPDADQEK